MDLGVCNNITNLLVIETYHVMQEVALDHLDMVEDQDIANTSNVLDQSKDCHSVRASMIQKKVDQLALMQEYTVNMVYMPCLCMCI